VGRSESGKTKRDGRGKIHAANQNPYADPAKCQKSRRDKTQAHGTDGMTEIVENGISRMLNKEKVTRAFVAR
jgi:hypothetical protein